MMTTYSIRMLRTVKGTILFANQRRVWLMTSIVESLPSVSVKF